MTDPVDWTRTAEQQVLDEAIRIAPSEGWTSRMTRLAGRAAGFSDGETELLLPRGPADLAALLSRRHDARALLMLEAVDPKALKIRERIAQAVEARIDAAGNDEAAARRWCGWLTLPQNLALGGQLAWESADLLWRWAGDVATDENHYSKRALLAGILMATLLVRLSQGEAAAEATLDRRIEAVMAFERFKGRVGKLKLGEWAAGAAGRLRYGLRG